MDSYLSGKEAGKAIQELSRHPSWFVVPQLLDGLLENIRNALEECPADKVVSWQARAQAVRDIRNSMLNVVKGYNRSKAIKSQGGSIYGKQSISPKK